MCHTSNPRLCWGSVIKNSEGAFKVAAPHVPFTLKITAEGYEEWWAPNGVGKDNSMTVPSGTQIELSCTLHRKPEFANRPMTEAEKQPLLAVSLLTQMICGAAPSSRERPRSDRRHHHNERYSNNLRNLMPTMS
jgi:hypothetical protein